MSGYCNLSETIVRDRVRSRVTNKKNDSSYRLYQSFLSKYFKWSFLPQWRGTASLKKTMECFSRNKEIVVRLKNV